MADRGALVSRYRRYKAGTKQVVNWLVTNASKCCDLSTRFDSFRSCAQQTTHEVTITTSELRELATIIAEATPAILLPAEIQVVLQDVLALRKECTVWYGSRSASDAGHAHFVTVLESVQATLKKSAVAEIPDHLRSKSKKPSKAPRRSDIDNVGNIFECLKLEEPSLAPLGVRSSGSSRTTVCRFDVENVTLKDDADVELRMAIICFLKDMESIRHHIRSYWLDYRDGKLSLSVASILTEIAFEMMRSSFADFVDTNSQFANWASITSFLRLQVAINNNVVYLFPKEDATQLQHDLKSDVNMADLLCTSAHLLLRTFREASTKYFESCDETSDSGILLGSVPAVQSQRPSSNFESVILSLLPETTSIKARTFRCGMTPTPELERLAEFSGNGLIEALVEVWGVFEHPPFWTVLICQSSMDIHEILKGDQKSPGNAMLAYAKRTLGIIDNVYKSLPDIEGASEFNLRDWRNAATMYAVSMRDIIEDGRMLTDIRRKSRLTRACLDDIYNLRCAVPGLTCLPSAAGYYIHAAMAPTYSFDVGAANDSHLLLNLAHFYKAALRFGLLDRWDDMEFLLSQGCISKPLLTDLSSKAPPIAMLKNYLLDLGVETKTLYGKGPPKPPTVYAPELYPKAKKITSLTGRLVPALVQRTREEMDLGVQRGNMLDVVLTALTADTQGTSNATDKRKPQVFTPTQLLSTLKTEVIRDELLANFDYSGFALHCRRYLPAFYHYAFGDPIGRVSMASSFKDPVYCLMETAAYADAKNLPVADTPFGRAAKLLNEWDIKSRGNVFSQEAYDLSSGTLAAKNRPQIPTSTPNNKQNLDAIKQLLPGASIGWSSSIIEIHHPNGSAAAFDKFVKSKVMRKVAADGVVRDTHVIVPKGGLVDEEAEKFDSRQLLVRKTAKKGT